MKNAVHASLNRIFYELWRTRQRCVKAGQHLSNPVSTTTLISIDISREKKGDEWYSIMLSL